MGETKGVIIGRRQEESKMTKRMGSLELEILRGYNLTPDSTFYQSRKFGASGTLANTGSSSSQSLTMHKKRNLASSVKSLPPLGMTGTTGGHNMPRNNSSMI